MAVFVSLLRGINVSGQNRIAMPDLKQLYEALGLGDVQTYVQSGNVVFTCQQEDESQLAKSIEASIQEKFGYEVPVLLRSGQELERISASNPFLGERAADPAFLHVTFFYMAAPVIQLNEMPSPNADGDEFAPGEREIFLYCPNGYGRTKLSNGFFERKLKVTATTRNWKTVNALADLSRKVGQK
jgi:uncharacterized protein (DUF1697 family)